MIKPAEVVLTFAKKFQIDPHEATLYSRLFAHHLADVFYDAARENGSPVLHSDPISFREWLLEIESAAARANGHPPAPGLSLELHQNPTRECSECRHEHEGREECGKYLGEEKFCRCTAKVTA